MGRERESFRGSGHQVVMPTALRLRCERSLPATILVGGALSAHCEFPGKPSKIARFGDLAHISAGMKTPIQRREFLHKTGVLTGVLALGGPLALVAPSRAWALDLTSLTSAEGVTLMAAARTIAPHDKLEDAAYALVVRALDTTAAKDEAVRKELQAGVASLGATFAANPENARVEALRRIEPTPFFQNLRIQTLQVLYSSPLAYACFGYEGEAFSKGGYLLRGFNDLRWLPEVPLTDSGPVLTAS
jgi:hypothetical protein